MDSNQLIKALADAVAAARPAKEYCLAGIDHWSLCMTKAEWSGWMQAIFSVVAIVAAFLVVFITYYLDTRRAKKRGLELADHVALRVRHRLGLLLQSATPTLDLLRNACETPMNSLEVDAFVDHLANYTIDDEKLIALLPANRQISHSLNQAYSIFAECSHLLTMSKDADIGEYSQTSFAQQTYTSMSSAFSALAHASTGLDDYLRWRGFSIATFDKLTPASRQ